MKSSLRPNGVLVVTHSPRLLQAVGVALLGYAAFLLLDSNPEPGQRLAGACVVLLAAVALLAAERSRFVFDPQERKVYWRRERLLGRVRGEVDFAQIEGLAMESHHSPGERGRTKRLALVTKGGRIPVTTSYTSFTGGLEVAAESIHTVLGRHVKVDLYR